MNEAVILEENTKMSFGMVTFGISKRNTCLLFCWLGHKHNLNYFFNQLDTSKIHQFPYFNFSYFE